MRVEIIRVVIGEDERPLHVSIELTLGLGVVNTGRVNPATFLARVRRGFDTNEQQAIGEVPLKEFDVRMTSGVTDNPERIDRTPCVLVFDGQATEDRRVFLPFVFAPSETENNVSEVNLDGFT